MRQKTVLNVAGDGWGKEIADGTFDAVIDFAGVAGHGGSAY